MKQKYRKGLIGGILVITLLMVVTQCKESPVVQNHTEPSEQTAMFQKAFNSNEFDSVISFGFKINWETETTGYSEELGSTYFEYLIEPKNIYAKDGGLKEGQQGKTTYKLIAIEKSGEPEFYVLKLYGSSDSNEGHLSWSNLHSFSGLLIVSDKFDNEIVISRIEDGEKVGEGKEISKERLELIQTGRMKMALGCYTEIIYHYIHWYQQNPDGSWDYLDSQYLGSSSFVICPGGTGGSGDPIGGDTGGGTSVGTSGDGDYQDCPDTVHGCYHEVEEKLFEAVYESPDKPIIDVDEYVKCFDTNTSAQVTVYSDQPNPGTRDAYNGTDVGHAFFTIEQSINGDIIRRTMGFYPDEDIIKPYVDESSPGIMGNDSGKHYNVKIDRTISSSQLGILLNTIRDDNKTYHLENNNCTHLAIMVANMMGLNINYTQGSWPGGSGPNPGDFGEDLISIGASRISGNASSNSGNCN